MEGNSLVSFENLCKIFEMRIKLDRDNGVKSSLDVLNNYEKYCKKIDNIYNNEFQKELKPLISPAVTLEKEKDRLRRLIKLLEDRLDRRVELEDRYYETTDKYISGLQMIVSEGELGEKRERLSLITKYLDTSDEIKSVSESILELNRLLVEEETKKIDYEAKNKILEDELYSSFMNIIKSDEYYKAINENEITSELESIRGSVIEAKETLDITNESIGTLAVNGIDDDYASYIEEAEKTYYNVKNKEIILNLYKLVTEFEDEFKLICAKRDKIKDLLNEKKYLSDSLTINTTNELASFENDVLLQCSILDKERDVLDNINNYNSRIKFKEERLEELNKANSVVEILAILREYGLIDTYDTEEVLLEDMEEEKEYNFDIPELVHLPEISIDEIEPVVEEVYDPYRVVSVIDYPKTLNVGLAKLKGESVREKVNKKLNPKILDVQLEDVNSDNSGTILDIPSTVSNDNNVSKEVTLKVDNLVSNEVVTPVWELPTEIDVNSVSVEDTVTSSLPVWEAIKPKFDVPVTDKPEEFNNMFWMPVSGSKIENSSFPNLNISASNGNNDFIFPSINN